LRRGRFAVGIDRLLLATGVVQSAAVRTCADVLSTGDVCRANDDDRAAAVYV
jgi:hypothetical protein